MFEQSLYNQEAFSPVPESNAGDLFHNYEFKQWNLTPRLYKIFAGSIIFNLLFLILAAQADLTKKGCDTFITSAVCQVIDTAYVANVLFGTKREYADAVYEKTELKDADITFVDVTSDANDPPLQYPEGYFALANPNDPSFQVSANPSTPGYIAPGIPAPIPSGTNNLLAQKSHPPKANPNAVEGPEISSPLGDSTDDQTASADPKGHNPKKFPGTKNGNGQPSTSPNANANTAVGNGGARVDEAKEDQFGVYINKRPLKDQAKDTIDEVAATKLKLDDPFKVVISATLGLGSDGKTIVLKDPKAMPIDKNTPNNAALAKLAQMWIIRVGDAGWFGYLDKFGSKKKGRQVLITVEQNDAKFTVSVRSQQASEEEARTAASGLNSALSIATPLAKGDEQLFLQAAKPVSDGKSLVLNVEFEKAKVQEMIQRKLAEAMDPTNQPSSTAVNGPANNSSSR